MAAVARANPDYLSAAIHPFDWHATVIYHFRISKRYPRWRMRRPLGRRVRPFCAGHGDEVFRQPASEWITEFLTPPAFAR